MMFRFNSKITDKRFSAWFFIAPVLLLLMQAYAFAESKSVYETETLNSGRESYNSASNQYNNSSGAAGSYNNYYNYNYYYPQNGREVIYIKSFPPSGRSFSIGGITYKDADYNNYNYNYNLNGHSYDYRGHGYDYKGHGYDFSLNNNGYYNNYYDNRGYYYYSNGKKYYTSPWITVPKQNNSAGGQNQNLKR